MAPSHIPRDQLLGLSDFLRYLGVFQIDEGEAVDVGNRLVNVAGLNRTVGQDCFDNGGLGMMFLSLGDLFVGHSKLVQ